MKRDYQAPDFEVKHCAMAITCTKSGMSMCKTTFVEL